MKHAAEERRIAGRYRLREELGSGSHGKVHLAVDDEVGGEVAVKLSSDGSSDHALLREFEVLGSMRHPNLLRALDHGRDRHTGAAYLVLEYVAGRALDRCEDLGEVDAADLLAQACRGLGYLHARGLVHGDVKPPNLLVHRRPGGGLRLHVIDLGLSLREGEGQRGVLRGTARYAAPSVLRGEPPTRQCDLYSLGMCFRRFTRDSGGAVAPRFEGILRRLLAEDEDARYQSAERVIDDLRRAVPDLARREDGIFLTEAPLVGRAAAMAGIEDWLQRALRAEGGEEAPAPLEIRGREGMGRTRMLDELEHVALMRGGIVCRASCPPGPLSPFEPLRHVLRHLAVILEEEDSAEARDLLHLARSLGGGRVEPSDYAAGDSAASAECVRLLHRLEAATRGRALLVVLDDCQWADASTAGFLRFLRHAPRAGGPHFAFAGGDPGNAPAGIHVPVRGGGTVRIELGPLAEEDAIALAASFLGSESEDLRAARRIATMTGGDPTFLVSVARAWARARTAVDPGDLEETIGRWLPPSLRALHERHMLELTPAEHRLAEELSVLTRSAPAPLVEAMSTLAPETAAPALEALHARGVLTTEVVDGVRGHRFAVDSLRRFVLDRLDRPRRVALHRRAARAWTRLLDDPRDKSEVLVEHFLGGEQWLEAAAHGVVAARRHVARHGHREAIALCERLLEGGDVGPWEADLRESLADARHGTGAFREARIAYRGVVELLSTCPADEDRRRQMVRLLRKQGAVEISLGAFDTARAHLREALAGALEGTDAGERARILEHLAHVEYRLGKVEEAKELLRQGLGESAGEGAEATASDLWNDLGIIEYRQGHYERALEHHRRALDLRNRARDLDGQSRSLTNLANVALATGDVDEARRHYEASLSIKELLGNAHSIAVTLYNLALLDHRMGCFGSAIERLEDTGRRQREISDASGRIRSLASLARVWLDKGELDLAGRLAGAAVRMARRRGHRESILTAALIAAARVEIMIGRPESALALLQDGLAVAATEGLLPDEGVLRALMGEALHFAGARPAAAASELRQAIEIARGLGDGNLLALCLVTDGERALDAGEVGGARQAGLEALGILERLPAPLLHIRARMIVGRTACATGRTNEAANLLHGALSASEELGLPELQWQGCAALAEFHGRRGRGHRALSWVKKCASVLESILARISDPAQQDSYMQSRRRSEAMALFERIATGPR